MARRTPLKSVSTTPPSVSDAAVVGATPAEVRAWAETLPERFLECRDMNHSWRRFNVGRHKSGGFERTLRCSRCRSRKIQHVSDGGLILGSRYEHSDGYLAEGLGRLTGDSRGQLRLALMTREADLGDLPAAAGA